MSSDKETDDTDQEICELLDPNRVAELELSRQAEMDYDPNRRPERKRNIVKRQISFNKKAFHGCVPVSCQDSTPNFESVIAGPSSATVQDPFRILVCHGSGEHYEVNLNRLITLTSDRFSVSFKSVFNNFVQTWNNISDLQPILDETISAFQILSPERSKLVSQNMNENSDPISDDTVQSQGLKEITPTIPLKTEDNKDSPDQIFQSTDAPEEVLSFDTVKNILDLPGKKLYEDSSEIENLIVAESFDQIIFSNYGCEYLSGRVEGGKCSSTATESSGMEIESSTSTKVESLQQSESSATGSSSLPEKGIQSSTSRKVESSQQSESSATGSSSLPEKDIQSSTSRKVEPLQQSESSGTGSSSYLDIEMQSSTSTKVESMQQSESSTTGSSYLDIESSTSLKIESHPQKSEKISESSKEKMQVEEISISSPFGQILNDALSKLDRQPSLAEPRYQSLVDNLTLLPYPGDQTSSEAAIKEIEYNVNHRILQFQKDVPRLLRNILNYFNRIECLVRKWPLNTSIRTLKLYLGFVLDLESKVVKFNVLSLKLKSKIESDRLRSLSGRPINENENSDYSLDLYKKYCLAVKYISALEEVRGLSEKFYSYIVKPLPSFVV